MNEREHFAIEDTEDDTYYAGPDRWVKDIRSATWYQPRSEAQRVRDQIAVDDYDTLEVVPVPDSMVR